MAVDSLKTRKYTKKDEERLTNLIKGEGFGGETISISSDMTFITDIGFFSFKFDHGVPRLRHFLVYKPARSYRNALKLFHTFVNMIKGMGYKKIIMQSPKEKPEMSRWIKRYNGIFIGKISGDKFYMVEV